MYISMYLYRHRRKNRKKEKRRKWFPPPSFHGPFDMSHRAHSGCTSLSPLLFPPTRPMSRVPASGRATPPPLSSIGHDGLASARARRHSRPPPNPAHQPHGAVAPRASHVRLPPSLNCPPPASSTPSRPRHVLRLP